MKGYTLTGRTLQFSNVLSFLNQSTIISLDWSNTFRIILSLEQFPGSLDYEKASLTEYPACYSNLNRALLMPFTDVLLVQNPQYRTKSHPSLVLLQRQITSEVDRCLFAGKFAKIVAGFVMLKL